MQTWVTNWCALFFAQVVPVDDAFHCYTLHEPVGVVGTITPWNFPLLLLAWKIGPALATGCTIVAKVDDKTPLSALRLGEIALEVPNPAPNQSLALTPITIRPASRRVCSISSLEKALNPNPKP